MGVGRRLLAAVVLVASLGALLAAAAFGNISVFSSRLSVVPQQTSGGDVVPRDYDLVVEPYFEQLGRTGYRVRPRDGQSTGPLEAGSGCLRNPIVNDVVCTPFRTRVTIDLTEGGRHDRVVIRENQRESDVLAAPIVITGTGVPPELTCLRREEVTNVTAKVELGDGNDSFSVRPSDANQALCTGDPSVVGRPWGMDVSELEILGGAGNDTIVGFKDADVLDGGSGSDTIDGGADRDVLRGGAGNDDLTGGTNDDDLDGGDGNDTLQGGSGNDDLAGGAGNDELRDTSGTNEIDGGAGDDNVLGSPGTDRIDGGTGSDDLFGNDGNDTVLGVAGDDTMFGGRGNDVLDGGLGGDSLRGEDGIDLLRGGPGSDFLRAGNGDDVVYADDDGEPTLVDTVDCGEGWDVLYADNTDNAEGCELVLRHANGDGLPGHVTNREVRRLPGGIASVAVRCPQQVGIRCRGELSVTASGTFTGVIYKTSYDVPIGGSRNVGIVFGNSRPRRITVRTVEPGQSGQDRSGTAVVRIT